MKKKILIFGSGSIGTHHANAAISLNYDVFITDRKDSQLNNMRENLYPERYGKWNDKIKCVPYNVVFGLKYNFDLVIIGVPPASHLDLIKLCKKNIKFKKILVEKPLCAYNQNFNFLKKNFLKNKIFCGFNHSISKSILYFLSNLKKALNKNKSKVEINIEWKESFNLVLKAHPWIKSLNNSYLSNYKIGGGVCQEYSHAIHFFVILKEFLFKSNTCSFKKKINFKKVGKFKYDKSATLTYFDKSKKLNLFLNSINNPPIKKIIVKVKEKEILKWERILEKKREVFNMDLSTKKHINFPITRREDFINEINLLVNKKNTKNLNYLKLNYAIKVNLLLRRIFKDYV